jgi:hypothetical protein
MLQWYLNGPVLDLSHSILSLLYILEITKMNFMKFAEGITKLLCRRIYHSFPGHAMYYTSPFQSH